MHCKELIMLKGNKGEWSEIYALFKLLGDTQLFTGDADLNKIETIFYPIIKIIRKESTGDVSYQLNGNLVIVIGGKEKLEIPVATFATQAASLLSQIKTSTGAAFSIPEVEAFMLSINCHSIAEKSTSKSDIRIVIHDKRINQAAELGFSIKSQLGGDSTLFNSNKRKTNFIYKINNLSQDTHGVERINAINPSTSKIKKRIEEIIANGGNLTFHAVEGHVLKNNLTLIDSLLPHILAEIILDYFSSGFSTVKDLTRLIDQRNPLNFDMQHAHSFYEYKIKHFLTDSALGMTGSKVWTGVYDVTGGYLIVKNNGDVLCYHIYNRNQFEDYLFSNTKLDTPSSTRHEFGTIYEENGEFFFALNLQVRFK